jgi:hypothetical protein
MGSEIPYGVFRFFLAIFTKKKVSVLCMKADVFQLPKKIISRLLPSLIRGEYQLFPSGQIP